MSQAEAAAREAADPQAALDATAFMAVAAEVADLQAALDAAAAMAAVQAPANVPAVEEDDGVDWDAAIKSSDDDGGDGGAGKVVNLADSDDE